MRGSRHLLEAGKMNPFETSREIHAATDEVFAAFSDPERLCRWWGPAGFTSTFKQCDFRKEGRWLFVLHGPDGKDYKNECVFEEIEAPTKIVIRHVSGPKYRLTVILAPSAGGTRVSWSQAFDNPDVAGRIAHIVVPSNEQNLDRLTAEVLREPVKSAPEETRALEP